MATPVLSPNLPKAFLALLLFALVLNVGLVAPYLLALFLGWIFATVLNPFFLWVVKKTKRPRTAAVIATLLATFTIILPIGGFGFLTVKNVIRLAAPYVKEGVNVDLLLDRAQAVPLINRIFDDQEELRGFAEENGKKVVARISTIASNSLAALPEVALQLVLALLTCYFILVDGRKLADWMSTRVPLDRVTQSDLAKNLNETAYSSFLSMFFASLAQSLVILLAFLVLKVPLPMLAFGAAFICAWFPIFGVTPVWITALLYLVFIDRGAAAGAMAVFGLFASLTDNVVRPWVIKDREDVHPLVSLVSIFGAIQFFGIIGVLVGPVAAGCLIEFLKIWPSFADRLGLKPTAK